MVTPVRNVQKIVEGNFSALSADTMADIIVDLQLAIQELQAKVFISPEIESDGMPVHGSVCSLMDGQFLRLTQLGAAPYYIPVEHGLDRRPQGIINIRSSSQNQAIIEGNEAIQILPANTTLVTIKLNGSVNEVHIILLF